MPVAKTKAGAEFYSATISGRAKMISWPELENVLRRAGELRPAEAVGTFVLSEEGLYIIMEE